MLYLKEANTDDIEKEYEFITSTPENENGFINTGFGSSREEFENEILPKYLNYSKGIGLQDGHVPQTMLFLWNDCEIVGLFKLRHYLTESLLKGSGHIGYGIGKSFRGKGYATEGLRLTVERAWKIIREDEIYMSVSKNNPASLKVQLSNGAYIHHEDDLKYYTRIKRVLKER